MSRYSYQVKDAGGRSESGVVTANDLMEATRLLRKDGKVIVSIHPEAAEHKTAAAKKKVRRDDVIFFATQLAVMVDTGVPLSDALDSIADQTDHTGLKAVVQDLADQVKSGIEFSAALERHPKLFSRLFVALMKASEASGTMGQMLTRVSDYMEQERDTIKKIKSAMTYPICMLGFCAVVVVGLLVFILPRFEKIYEGKGAILPLPTRILLGLSNGLVSYWYLVLAIGGAIVAGCYFYFRTPTGRIVLDGMRIHAPVLGKMYQKAYLARSLRTMATMVSTGVSMLDGLAITSQVAGNYFYQRIWNDLSERVKEGSSLAEQLAKSSIIPKTVSSMISAGEKTGKLGNVMNRVAKFCEDDMSLAIKAMTSMIEPAMIIIMGLIVGGVAMALLLPIFSISKVVAH